MQLVNGIRHNILASWSLAASKPIVDNNLRVASVEGGVRISYVTISVDNNYGVLVPLRPSERVQVGNTLKSNTAGALRAEVAQFSGEGNVVNALHVWCADYRCLEAFSSFVELLILRLDAPDLGHLLGECHREFQRLIGGADASRSSVVIGLVGELLVLRDLVRLDQNSVRGWGGPRGERHDFRLNSTAIEVKTTQRAEVKTSKVRITDWDQLVIPENGRLYLHVVRLERAPGNGVSAISLIDEVTSLLGADGVEFFHRLLGTFGDLLAGSSDEFSVLSRGTYRVVDGFPRLVPDQIKADAIINGVSGVSYDLNLAFAEEHSVSWESATSDFVTGEDR